MLSFIIIVLLAIVLWPLLSAGWKILSHLLMLRRFMNDPMAEMQRQAQRRAKEQQRSQRSTGPFSWFGFNDDDNTGDEMPRRRKKIPDDIGEYIPFQEIIISETELRAFFARTAVAFRREEQISDIKWTDL